MPRPGCVLRGALVSFGLLFLPMGLWFAYSNFSRYWGQALVLMVISIVFLRLGFVKDEDSWMAAIDELGAEPRDKTRKHE